MSNNEGAQTSLDQLLEEWRKTNNATFVIVAVAPITGEKIAVINMLKLPWNLEIHAVENRKGQKG